LNRQTQDRKILKKIIRTLDKKKILAKSPGQLMLQIGKLFLKAPYASGTLDKGKKECLVVNLRELDCVTCIENVVALTGCVNSRVKSFETFKRLLRKIRYRQGRLQGYTSRLHYFSDWIYDNQKKGIVRDVTAEIGGRSFNKTLNFMTTYSDFYPKLNIGTNLRKMKSMEKMISKRHLYYIPKRSLKRLEDRIDDGDVIAITTNIKGLDIQHVGLATKVNNRVHLLHASSKEGKVALSKKNLYQYLMEDKNRSGIMVARL
jgi:N-acetylmuramoyl-L-alanine amidase-like